MSVILFPTDFSGYSENAFQYILHFADRLRAKIIFQYVMPVSEKTSSKVKKSTAEEDDRYKNALQQIHELKFRAADFAFRQDCEIVTDHIICEGDAADEILKAAKEIKPLMIAISTNGYNAKSTMHVGNTTATVLKKSKFPMLVIPEHAFYKKVNNIALVTDLDERDESLIYKLMITAALFKAKVHVFHLDQKKTKGAQQVVEYLSLVFKYPLQIHKLSFQPVQSKAIASGIDKYIKQHTVDLLCMEHHKYFFPELFEVKHADRKNFQNNIPTLVYYDEI
ncbi:MAG: universal stress protein [Fimbriimonadaceae bacterium]|nr:universal stress protein [Chitinophagales bacterium]